MTTTTKLSEFKIVVHKHRPKLRTIDQLVPVQNIAKLTPVAASLCTSSNIKNIPADMKSINESTKLSSSDIRNWHPNSSPKLKHQRARLNLWLFPFAVWIELHAAAF
jgi:hypothetical protein